MRTRPKRHERAQLVHMAPYFDAPYYLSSNPDVARAGLDPALHYLRTGWKEGRAPNSWFDGPAYLTCHADVAGAGLNPLLHYAKHGRAEGRALSGSGDHGPERLQRPHDAVRRIIEGTQPAREIAVHYQRTLPNVRTSGSALVSRIVQDRPDGAVLSISHDDYAENFGGVQRLIESEVEQFTANSWRYIHVSPSQPLPTLSDNLDIGSFFFNIRLDGVSLGAMSAADLIEALSQVNEHGPRVDVVVHHLMGHSPEIVSRICQSLAIERPVVWIHDFYSLCENPNLLRNGWKFCHAPRLDSTGCRLCVHGSGRVEHFTRMLRFFTAMCPSIIAPSEAALSTWKDRGLLHYDAHIAPIAQIVKSRLRVQARDRTRLRVAFIGQSLHIKGWTTYRELVERCAATDLVEFYHLGTQTDDTATHPRIRFVPVRADRGDRDAMTRALAEHAIDLVVIWSAWPETFCYAAHEALVAGTVVVTNRQAGNVPSALALHAPSRSAVLDTPDDLFELFRTPQRLLRLCEEPAQFGVMLPYQSSANVVLKMRSTPSAVAARLAPG